MADATYGPKVYHKQGGDEVVVASGGKITLESGGEIDVQAGGKVLNDGTQAAAIASLTDNSGGTANDTLEDVPATYNEAALANNFADLGAKINSMLAALRGAGIIVT